MGSAFSGWRQRVLTIACVIGGACLLVGGTAQAQIAIPGGSIAAQNGQKGPILLTTPNNYGGQTFIFANASGGSIGGDNYGGIQFAFGTLDPAPGAVQITSYGPYVFQKPPGSNDTVAFFDSSEGSNDPNANIHVAGTGGTDVSTVVEYGYTYPLLPVGTPHYVVQLGGQAIAELDVLAVPVNSQLAALAVPSFNLTGTSTVSKFASFQAQDGSGTDTITITGSGSLTTPTLQFGGNANVSGGTLHGDTTTVDSTSLNPFTTGADKTTSTTLTLTGAKAVLQAPTALYIGKTAGNLATLALASGASAATGNVYLGFGSSTSNGSLTLDAAKIMTDNGFAAIGYNGVGHLNIAGGGSWILNGTAGDVFISGLAGSTGTAVVSGASSQLNAGGYIIVGQQGQGSLYVTNGAVVTGSQGVYVGNNAGANAAGTLDIASGGQVKSANSGGASVYAAILGGATGANGTATIDGSGSIWQVAQSMRIGADGTGNVTLQDGGKLEVDGATLEIGSLAGGTGTLTLNGSGSTFALPNGALIVGDAGTGTVSLQNGAMLDQRNKTLVLGSQATGNGTIQVQSGSSFNVANLTLGGSGTGELDLGSTEVDGTVTTGTANITGKAITIGSATGSNGTLEINGKSTLNFSGSFQDGVAGTGNIELQSGASLSAAALTLGASSGGTGNLKLDSASSLTSTSTVTLGSAGQGNLTLLNGSQATIGGDLILGQNFGSTGSSVSVQSGSGSTSKLTVTGNLVIGQADQSGDTDTVTIQSGSQASIGKDLTVGGKATNGTLTIAGNGTGSPISSLQYGGQLNVNAAGSVTVNNAGVLKNAGGGGTDNIAGDLMVQGAGSDWKASSTVSLTKTGSLKIQNGAHAELGTLNIDSAAAGTSTVSVSGSGNGTSSQLMLTSTLDVDNGGSFILANGAMMTANQLINVGLTAGNATLDVSGEDTFLDAGKATTTLSGGAGSGALSVTGGADAMLGDLYMNSGSSLLVSGLGTNLTIASLSQGSLRDSSPRPSIEVNSRATLNIDNGSSPNFISKITIDDAILNVPSSGLGFSGQFSEVNGSTVKINGTFDDADLYSEPLDITNSAFTATNVELQKGSGTANITNSVLNLDGEFYSGDTVNIDGSSTVTGIKTIIDYGTVNLSNAINVKSVFLEAGTINLGSTGMLTIGYGTGFALGGGSQLYLGAGGSLSGTGSIQARSFTNGGMLHVGDDPGTIDIAGNYTQLPTGTLQIEVGPTSVSQLNVTGAAALAGTLALEPVDGATIRLGQTYDILNATGGISGAFSTYDTGSQFIALVPQLNGGMLDFTTVHAPNSFADVAQTANQAAVAEVLDAAADGAAGGLADGIDALSSAKMAAVQSSFETLSGEAYGDLATVAIEQSRGFSAAMLDRLGDVANGAADNVGIALTGDGSNLGFRPNAAPAQSGASGIADRAYSVWAEGSGHFSNNTGGAYGSHSFNTSTSGIVAGLDASIKPNWVAGAAFGYGYSDLNASTLQSNATLDDYDFALYSGATFGRVYVRGDAGYVSGNASLTRGLDVAGMQSGATGSPDSRQMFGALETGEDLALAPGLSLTPYARLDAARYWQDSVDESNAGAFGLLVAGQQVNSLQTTLGSGLAKSFGTGSATPLTLTVKAGWAHEFAETGRPVTAAFASAPDQEFTVQGASVNRNTAVVSTGLSMATGKANVFIRYDGQYGSLQSSNAITGGIVFTW